MKIAIIGAAGVRTPLILKSIALRKERLGLKELALMDVDQERLSLIGALTQPFEKQAGITVTRTTDLSSALSGADYVITTFRIGGIASRIIDERVPLDLGLVGQETTGAGGFAMAIRSIPILLDIVRQMEQYCPQAWLVNFANPSGMLAEAVLKVAGWSRAVGICDAPSSLHRVASAILQAAPETVYLDYFGLNHLGWVRSIQHAGKDYLPQILNLIQVAGQIPELPFPFELIKALGMIPNEYLYYYYFSKQAVQNIREKGKTRGEQILEENEHLVAELTRYYTANDGPAMMKSYERYLDKRSSSYMKTETGIRQDIPEILKPVIEAVASGEGYAGVALDLIEALQGNQPKVLALNILNQGAVTGMQADDVVEIPALVSKDAIHPLSVGVIPDHCLGLMKQIKVYERLTISAAVENSYQKAVQALTLHPLVADYSLASAIVNTYITQHGSYFPKLI